VPFYKLCEFIPSTRAGAQRLGLVSLRQMTTALLQAAENPASDIRIVDVPQIRAASRTMI
jgi:hypothetical protein